MSGPVLIAAGGTGGHVIPALAVARLLRERAVPVIWAGTERGLESRLVPDAGIELERIRVHALRGQGGLDILLAPLRLVRSIGQCIALVRRLRPRAVLGMGGFVSGPVALAALALRVPLVLHEQNALAGLTNRRLARFATRVFAAFPDAFADGTRVEVVGNPVSAGMTVAPLPALDTAAPLRLLVVGGSRGAERLNTVLPEALSLRGGTRPVTVVHQAGRGRAEATRARYAAAGAQRRTAAERLDEVSVRAFLDDMPGAYRDADLVVCRSGAMTVTELAARGRAAVLVPYPYAVDDHQSANARWLTGAGAAILMPETRLSATALAGCLDRLEADRAELVAMSRAAAGRFVPGAAERVAEALLAVSGGVPDGPPGAMVDGPSGGGAAPVPVPGTTRRGDR